LIQALKVLRDVKGIGKVEFGKKDIIRHQLVQRIVEAYEKWDELKKLELTNAPADSEPSDNNQD
jgi:phosphate starvation-inducible PhoH-like protein